MANFYTEHPELRYHLNNPMMERICELKERNYRDKEELSEQPDDGAHLRTQGTQLQGQGRV